nr:YigZ family protein [Luteimonas galliterrae]
MAAPASHAIEVKHSRFLAHAAPADSPEAALGWLSANSDRNATHNCWAYRIGELYRSSDDGEPSGTAGRPILAAIDGQGLDRVIVVVTRWYGGINLGAGGLVRAYGGAAAECLRRAERTPLIVMAPVRLFCPFADVAEVHAALAAFGAEKKEENFDAEGVNFVLSMPLERVDGLKARLRDATRNRVRFAE